MYCMTQVAPPCIHVNTNLFVILVSYCKVGVMRVFLLSNAYSDMN